MIYEILEKAAEAPSRVEKIEVLKKYNCLGLRDVLRGAYDDRIQFTLPPGAPAFEGALSNDGNAPTSLHAMTPRFSYWVKGGKGDGLPALTRERLFLEVLEGVHPKEAEVLIAMKDKKFAGKYKGITKALVMETWPNLIKDGTPRANLAPAALPKK
jgi:hypothetical protein